MKRLNVGSDAEMAMRFPFEITADELERPVQVYAANAAEAVALFCDIYSNAINSFAIRLMSDNE